jgi:hypothetical protein
MANLGQKSGIFHIRFRYHAREYKKSLKVRDESAAKAAKNLVELTIHRLVTGQIGVPDGVDPGDFILSGWTLLEPRPDKLAERPTLPATAVLIEEYKEAQRHLLAESYHYSQAMHLRHLTRFLGDIADAPCDKIGHRDLDRYLKARLAKRHPNTPSSSR